MNSALTRFINVQAAPHLVTAAAQSENVGRKRSAPMAYDYLKHGLSGGSSLGPKPLLVIAGAGTGKTKTLAHRVAHLIVNGVDAHRILLLTFSRRALDMTGRVKRYTLTQTQQTVSLDLEDLGFAATTTSRGIVVPGLALANSEEA